jgi:phosphoribosylaminoimidazole-succinocarboxamide synthase
MGLKAKLEAVSTKVTKVDTAVAAAATKVAVETLDGKLELVIRANSLKRTGG